MSRLSIQVYCNGDVAVKDGHRVLGMLDRLRVAGTVEDIASTLRWELLGYGRSCTDGELDALARRILSMGEE